MEIIETKTCGICYEEDNISSLPCNHEFCDDCLEKWKWEKMSCPICRSVLLPEIVYTTRKNFYGEDSQYIFKYWNEIKENDRLVEFLSMLAFAKHYILCTDVAYEKKHFLKKKVFHYSTILLDEIYQAWEKEKKNYERILCILLRLYEPEKRALIYQTKMSKLFETVSMNLINNYKMNASQYFLEKIRNNKELQKLREKYVESKLQNCHIEQKEQGKIELLEDEIFLEEQFFVREFSKEANVSGVFGSESDFFIYTESPYVENVPTRENVSQVERVYVSSDAENTWSGEHDSTTSDENDEQDENGSDDESCDCDDALQNMICKVEEYVSQPKMSVEEYVKHGTFQKDFMWFMKNAFMLSFFEIETNFPVAKFIYDHCKTIQNVFFYLNVQDSIYHETMVQFKEMYEFFDRDYSKNEEYYIAMNNIMEEYI